MVEFETHSSKNFAVVEFETHSSKNFAVVEFETHSSKNFAVVEFEITVWQDFIMQLTFPTFCVLSTWKIDYFACLVV